MPHAESERCDYETDQGECRDGEPDGGEGDPLWSLYHVTDSGESYWNSYPTREAAMATAEEMQYPGPDEGPDDITLVWSQNKPEGALEEWISPDGTAWHLHYGGR